MSNKPIACSKVRDRLQRFHTTRCPFCRVRMMSQPKPTKKGPPLVAGRDIRTKAHLHSRQSPKDSRDLYVYGCQGCNHDQGSLSLDEWLLILDHRKDSRADFVRTVVEIMIEEGVLP